MKLVIFMACAPQSPNRPRRLKGAAVVNLRDIVGNKPALAKPFAKMEKAAEVAAQAAPPRQEPAW